MGVRLNTNIQSLQARFNLEKTSGKLNGTLRRLSTGLRINSASDDVVGMTKSELLRYEIRGITQASQNVSNMRSLLNVSEGYLTQLTEIAHTLRQSAVQAADGTVDPASRAALSDYFTDMMSEFDRLSNGANYNGVNLLDGTFISEVLQIGPKSGDTISIDINDSRSNAIGQVAVFTANIRTATSTGATASVDFVGPDAALTVNGTVVPLTAYSTDGISVVDSDESAIAYVNAINSVAGASGVTASIASNVYTLDYSAGNPLESNVHLLVNGVTVKNSAMSMTVGDDTDAAILVSNINSQSVATGVIATIDTINDEILLTASDGRNIHLQLSDRGDVSGSYNVFGITGGDNNTQMAQRGQFLLQGNTAYTIDNAQDEFTTVGSEAVAIDPNTALSNASIATVSDSQEALRILDNVILQLQTRRSQVGGFSSRLDMAGDELNSRLENTTEAQSVIRDANFAVETAKLAQYQILQQAGVAVLAQANSASQGLLQLLQR